MNGIVSIFLARLDGVEHHVRLMQELATLRAEQAPSSVGRTRFGKMVIDTQSRLRSHRDWETISLDGCMLYLSAQFELAARDLAESLVNGIAARVKLYNDLPETLRDQNVRLVGELLANHKRARAAHINFAAVVRDLAACTTAGTPVSLFASGFATHERNLRHDQLAELYSRADVKDIWRRIGRDGALKVHLNTTNAQRTGEAASKKLDAFMEDRNQIVHRGPSYQTVGPTVVLDYVAFFRRLIVALAAVLEENLATY